MIPGPAERELELTPDRLPRTVWFAAVPPILVAVFLYWLRVHWNELPTLYSPDADPVWRNSPYYSPRPGLQWHESAFRSVLSGIVTFTVFGLWTVAQGIAIWFGSARTSFHNAQLNLAVTSAWQSVLLFSPIYIAGYLSLSWPWMLLCGISMATGLGMTFVFARRVKKAAGKEADSYNIGCYFDRQDPVMFGPRGMNLGHPWQWALTAGSLLICVIPFLLN